MQKNEEADVLNEEVLESEELSENDVEQDNAAVTEDKSAELLAEIDTLKKKLAAQEEETARAKDLMLRRQADFENYKRRMLQKEEEHKKLLVKDLAAEIIGINDDLLRAVEAAENIPAEQLEEGHKSFVDGVSLISNRIEDSLGKFGVVEIDSLNQEFDPMFNEAVEINMSADVKTDTITKVYQKGFRLDEYVIRSAKVCVTKPAN